MRIKVLFFILSFLVCNGAIFSQTTSIQTDRPDQTESPYIVPSKYIQIETGLVAEHVNSNENNFLLPTTLIKYGFNNNFELRISADLLFQQIKNETMFGLAPVIVGFKANLCHEDGIIPETSFIGQMTIVNLASPHLRSYYPAPSFRFTMQHSITERLNIGYNLGAEWDGCTPYPTGIYTATAGLSIFQGLSGFVELYGFISDKSNSTHNIDGGLTYLIGRNLQIDASTGIGIHSSNSFYFFSCGISYRFKCIK